MAGKAGWIVCTAILIGFGCTGRDAPVDRNAWVTIEGSVEDGAIGDGVLWFKFQRIDVRFSLDTARTPAAEAIFAALKDAGASGRSVYVRVNPNEGAFDEETGLPTYVVRAALYNGVEHEGQVKLRPGMLGGRKPSPAEKALLRAVALKQAGRYADALAALDQTQQGALDDPSMQLLAIRTRGEATESMATTMTPSTAARDSQLVRALSAFEQWAARDESNHEPQYAVARVLSDLGAYDEALARYRFITNEWPDEYFWPATRIAAIHRIRGDHAAALQVLDDLGAKLGDQKGMAFHYHRARALIQLDRFAEAVAQLDRGLESQPDYEWAVFERACAKAQLGRVREALEDQQRALEMLQTGLKEFTPGADDRHNLDNAARIARDLEGRLAENDLAPTSAPCDGYWDYGERQRERSPLLQQAQLEPT